MQTVTVDCECLREAGISKIRSAGSRDAEAQPEGEACACFQYRHYETKRSACSAVELVLQCSSLCCCTNVCTGQCRV